MTDRQLRVLPTRLDVEKTVAHDVLAVIAMTLGEQERCDIVVTGGGVGIGSLAAINSDSDCATIDWSRVHVWWGDERFVEKGSEDRNDELADRALLANIPLIASHVHRFPSREKGVDLAAAATKFDDELRHERGDSPVFDLVLNGIGPDGHVASLFPGREHGGYGELVVAVSDSPKPPPERLSLTFEALNGGRRVWIIAAGSDKAEAVERLVAADDVLRTPAVALHGSLETVIYADSAAAAQVVN